METLNEKYVRLAREYAAACERVREIYHEVNEIHAAWMEMLTRIGPGDLVKYEGKTGIFDCWLFEQPPQMTLLKEDGTVGEEKLTISDWVLLRLVEKRKEED